jgi:hypothetical protein
VDSPMWTGLDEQVRGIVARLRPVGKKIGEQAQAGDALAQRIVSNYLMLAWRVDPMAAHITDEALSEWEKRECHAEGPSGMKTVESDTPLTDAIENEVLAEYRYCEASFNAMAEHARELERRLERASALKRGRRMAEFQVWDKRGDDIEFYSQVDGPREQALSEARRYALEVAARDGGTAIIEEVTRVEVERLSGERPAEIPSEKP